MARKDTFNLEGKIALVNGGSRGIGESIACLLAEYGAHVIVSSRKLEGCEAVADRIRQAGGQATAMKCHVGNLDDIEKLFAEIKAQFGKLDILINNAGTNPYYGPIAETEPWAFDKTVEVNLRGPFFMSAKAVGLMKEKGGGAIVNVASIAGLRPGLFQGIYSTTKAALIAMTKAFALENSQYGIRVNAILPGIIETRFTEVFRQDPDAYAKAMSRLPIPRAGQPDEMAGGVLYLVSGASSYTTGTTLVMDGGTMIAS